MGRTVMLNVVPMKGGGQQEEGGEGGGEFERVDSAR